MRRHIVWITVAAGLLLVNISVYQKEQLLANGRGVLLELAPVDPRSLMQGDYMALRYALERELTKDLGKELTDGYLIVSLDDRQVATYQRVSETSATAPGEAALRLRVREGRPKIGSNAFFFEEGSAKEYNGARYGEYRVAGNGETLLVGLRDKDLALVGKRLE